jgi:hypothetical protein
MKAFEELLRTWIDNYPEKKMQIVTGIMTPRLSMVDTASLFGRVVKRKLTHERPLQTHSNAESENGQVRIVADYDGQVPMEISENDLEDVEDDYEYDDDFINDDDSDYSGSSGSDADD